MEVKNVIKIVFVSISLLFSILIFAKKQSEQRCINLIFDVKNKNNYRYETKNKIFFYIDDEVFVSSKLEKVVIFNKNVLSTENICNIKTFKEKAFKIRKDEIAKDTLKIKILKKSEYFDVIYLYELKGKRIYRYLVQWENAIID